MFMYFSKIETMKVIFTAALLGAVVMAGHAGDFSSGGLNFSTTGDAECRVIRTPDASGEIVIPEKVIHEDTIRSVTSIGAEAFRDCRNLQAVTFPSTIQEICDEAFSGCTAVERIVIPDATTSLGRKAFYNCTSLRTLIIGKSMQSLGVQVFDGADAISSVISLAPQPPHTAMYPFAATTYESATLTVPVAARGAYRAESPWNRFQTIIGDDHPGVTPSLTISMASGCVSTNETYGLPVTIFITAPEQHSISSVTSDGEDITSSVGPDGKLTLPPMTDDRVVAVVFRDMSGTEFPTLCSVKVSVCGNHVSVTGLGPDEPVRIVSTDGLTVYNGYDHEIDIPDKGVMILETGGETFKFRI